MVLALIKSHSDTVVFDNHFGILADIARQTYINRFGVGIPCVRYELCNCRDSSRSNSA